MYPDKAKIDPESAAAYGRSPYLALLGLENDSWFPETASSAIIGADGIHMDGLLCRGLT